MTITATPTAQTDAVQNELELLGLAWDDIAALTPDQLSTLWATFEQISPEERAAFATYIGSDLTAVTDNTVAGFRAHYVGTYPSAIQFVRDYARVRWFNTMASADAYAAFTTNLESVLEWIDYDRLTEALFHENRSPYTLTIGMGVDHVFTSREPQPSEPRISL